MQAYIRTCSVGIVTSSFNVLFCWQSAIGRPNDFRAAEREKDRMLSSCVFLLLSRWKYAFHVRRTPSRTPRLRRLQRERLAPLAHITSPELAWSWVADCSSCSSGISHGTGMRGSLRTVEFIGKAQRIRSRSWHLRTLERAAPPDAHSWALNKGVMFLIVSTKLWRARS